jgi:hypothetical protein
MPSTHSGSRRSRMAALALGLAIMGAASMVYYEFGLFVPRRASLAVWLHWLQSWVGVVLGYRRYTTSPLLGQLLGFGSGPSSNAMPIVVALVAALAVGWMGRAAPLGSHKFWLTLSFVLALTTITVIAGQSLCDHVILLPGILFLARHYQARHSIRMFRTLLAIGVGLLLWPWISDIAATPQPGALLLQGSIHLAHTHRFDVSLYRGDIAGAGSSRAVATARGISIFFCSASIIATLSPTFFYSFPADKRGPPETMQRKLPVRSVFCGVSADGASPYRCLPG